MAMKKFEAADYPQIPKNQLEEAYESYRHDTKEGRVEFWSKWVNGWPTPEEIKAERFRVQWKSEQGRNEDEHNVVEDLERRAAVQKIEEERGEALNAVERARYVEWDDWPKSMSYYDLTPYQIIVEGKKNKIAYHRKSEKSSDQPNQPPPGVPKIKKSRK
jgi:hypothetical protein